MSFKIKLKPPSLEVSAEKPKIKILKPTPPKKAEVKKGLKLTLNPKPKIKKVLPRIRVKPTRIPGEGYDSEDSDIEDDPLIEEGLILRLLPDAELDYVKQAIESGDFNNIHIKWKDNKRALVYINSSIYTAKLIRLPNIIEVQKTLDKKNIFKTIDVSQILLVVKQIENEEEIKELVVEDDETLDSGITPPLRHIGKSKYRKNLNNSYIQSLESKVDELLRLDEEAEDSQYELIDPESLNRESAAAPQYSFNEIEPEIELVKDTKDQVDDLELELEQVLGEDDLLVEEEVEEEEEEEDSEEDDEEDDEDSDNEQGVSPKVEIDEDEQHNALLRDEINELMSTIEQNKTRLEKTYNPLLQSRVLDSINKLEKELENKRRQLKTGEDKTKKDIIEDVVEEEEEEEGADDDDDDLDDLFG